MRRHSKQLLLSASLSLSALAATLPIAQWAHAQEAGSSQAAPAQTPKPGSTMQAVREKFGSPTQESPAVGAPPITRWDYPGYAVYFENDRVLHSVIK